MNAQVKNALKKAKKISEQLSQPMKDFEECIYNGVCPECGAFLELKTITFPEKGISYAHSRRGEEVTTMKTETTIVCPNQHPLIHPQYKWNLSDYSYTLHHNMFHPVKEIREFMQEHFSIGEDLDSEPNY